MKIQSPLVEEELAYLTKKFCLTVDPEMRYSIQAVDLLDTKKCEAYIDGLASFIGSPSRMITASQFAKRYAFLLVSLGLYTMTMFNKRMNVTVENILIESDNSNLKWSPNISLLDWNVTEPAAGKRDEWRYEMIGSLFAGHLSKLWRSVSKSAGIPMEILWENTAVRLYSLYEKRMGEEADSRNLSRIQDDFDYLLRIAPGTLFGERTNPLAKFYGPLIAGSSEKPQIRIRKTCCYFYQVLKGSFCSNCPKAEQ